MSENPVDAFAEQAQVASDQAQEIDPSAAPAREPEEQFEADQAQEIAGSVDEPIEPVDLPRTGG